MVMLSDGRPDRPQDTGNSGRHGARRGGSLTCPSKGGDDPPSCVSGDTAAAKHPHSVVVRAPSPASSLASGVGVTAAAGRLWGDIAAEGMPPSEQQQQQQGGGGRGLFGLKAKARMNLKGGKLGGWGQRKARRETELADWLENNTNLVNVSPW